MPRLWKSRSRRLEEYRDEHNKDNTPSQDNGKPSSLDTSKASTLDVQSRRLEAYRDEHSRDSTPSLDNSKASSLDTSKASTLDVQTRCLEA